MWYSIDTQHFHHNALKIPRAYSGVAGFTRQNTNFRKFLRLKRYFQCFLMNQHKFLLPLIHKLNYLKGQRKD